MRIKKNKMITWMLILLMLTVSIPSFAANSGISSAVNYQDAVSRLVSLGILSVDAQEVFNANGIVTRGQAAQIITIISGQEDYADGLSQSTVFPDVTAKNPYRNYINFASSKGLLTGLSDGKFHPGDGITFAQLCTAMVKTLGYSSQEVTGLWPKNFIAKAKTLHITDGLSFSANDKIQSWALAVMVDRLLDTAMKKNTASETAKTLAEYAELDIYSIYTVYSKPEIVKDFNPADYRVGSIRFDSSTAIVRNTIDQSTTPATNNVGEVISVSLIKENDVVYRVSNKSGTKNYILVVDNKVSGKITGILPDKYAPKTIQIESQNYDFSVYAQLNKFNSSLGSYGIGDSVTLLLDNNGKVLDAMGSVEETGHFAFVTDDSYFSGSPLYYEGITSHRVTLLFTDGTKGTYKAKNTDRGYKNKLVTFKKIDDETVELTEFENINPQDYAVDVEGRKLGDMDVAGNVKIYNYITNSTGKTTEVSLLRWGDLPSGTMSAGKVLCYNQSGPFNDVNLIVLKDAFNMTGKSAYIKTASTVAGGKSYAGNYTLLVDGKTYSFSTSYAFYPQDYVVKVSVINGNIDSISSSLFPTVTGSEIQAIDSRRIKLKNTIYYFASNASIYYKDSTGAVAVKGPYTVTIGKNYREVALFLDKPLKDGGKVEMITIKE